MTLTAGEIRSIRELGRENESSGVLFEGEENGRQG
jgi:hypothetical protein